jgi:hypothetical protein
MQQRLLTFITRSNWVLFTIAAIAGAAAAPADFALGIVSGGLIAAVNFHLLARTLKKALTPPHIASHNVVIAKYYLRFLVSGLIIFVLISGRYVAPVGLVIGLSVVVASVMLATLREISKLIFKEAV